MQTHKKGFTLIELLVVIGILAILLAITLIAINPARQFAQSNNTKRSSDVNAILNAINQNMADHQGSLPTGIDTTVRTIGNQNGTQVDLCAALVPVYIAALPVDPLTNSGTPVSNCATTYTTNYTVVSAGSGISAGNRITISAPAAELQATIQVTR